MNFELQKAERMNFSEHFKPTEVCNKNTRVIQNKKNVFSKTERCDTYTHTQRKITQP